MGFRNPEHDHVEEDMDLTYPGLEKPLRSKEQDRKNEEEEDRKMDRLRKKYIK